MMEEQFVGVSSGKLNQDDHTLHIPLGKESHSTTGDQSQDSHNSLLSFLLDEHYEGKTSTAIWDRWEYDYDYLRGVGFKTTRGDGEIILSWDSATLKREAEAYGWMFLEPGEEPWKDLEHKDVRLGEVPESFLCKVRALLKQMQEQGL